MESTKNSNKTVTLISLALLLLSIGGNVIFFSSQGNLKNERDKAFLKMDSLLSVKLLIEKELDQIKIENESYKGKNAELDKVIAEMDTKLTASKSEVDKLVKENASVSSLRKKLNDCQKLKDDCEKTISGYIKEIEKLTAQNSTLNKSVNTLTQQLDELKEKLEKAKNLKTYDMTVINYKVTKRGNKPTIKAKRVDRIAATFSIGENPIADPGAKEIFMVIYDSKNNIVGLQKNKFNNKTSNKEQVYSTSKPLDYKNEEVKMTINFDTELKLIKGKYKVEIYVDGTYSGKKEFILK